VKAAQCSPVPRRSNIHTNRTILHKARLGLSLSLRPMPSNSFQPPQDVPAHLLQKSRRQAGLTQIELADRLGIGRSSVSKVERGLQRLDLVELRSWLAAIGGPMQAQFAQAFDDEASAGTRALKGWRARRATP
jgi:DNA-binding XRE family transcriptional regulator